MLTELLKLAEQQMSKAEIARRLDQAWPTIPRMIEKAYRILEWIRQELKSEPVWQPSPCMHPQRCWSDFIRMFAAKFYPKRYGNIYQQNLYI